MAIFDMLTDSEDNAIEILKNDHARLKDIFDEFETASTRREKVKLVTEALEILKVHAVIEEEVFYPAVRRTVGPKLMNEADEEHHVAKLLVAELEKMDPADSHYDAKFTVLAEAVRHHIKEEEDEMMPMARDADIDFEVLGRELLARKKTLYSKGVPKSREAVMVAKANGHAAAKPKTVMKRAGKKKVKASKAAIARRVTHDTPLHTRH